MAPPLPEPPPLPWMPSWFENTALAAEPPMPPPPPTDWAKMADAPVPEVTMVPAARA